MRARVPADVDQPDRIVAGLTASQLGVLAASATLAWLVAGALASVAPLPVAVTAAVVPATIGLAVAFLRRDGLDGWRWVAALVVDRLAPRRLAFGAPEPAPPWASAPAPPAPLEPAVRRVDVDGLLDLGADGFAAVCEATTANLALRSEPEQAAVIAAFGRYLNALSEPVQFVIRAQRPDLTAHLDALRAGVMDLEHPRLEAAARSHIDALARVAACDEVVARRAYVALRSHHHEALAPRVEEAGRLLAAAGVDLRPLAAREVEELLASSADTTVPAPRPAHSEDHVVRGAS